MKIVIAALCLSSSAAYAGSTCHGGGGSSGSSSSSSGGSSSSSSSSYSDSSSYSSEPSAPPCDASEDIHGIRKCSKFGAWHLNLVLPRIVIELGTNVRQAPSGLDATHGEVTHGDESFAYRVVMPARMDETMVTTSLRLGLINRHGIYGMMEGEIGGIVGGSGASTEMAAMGTFGSPRLEQHGGLVVGGYAVAGARAALGRGTLAVELAGGLRARMYNFDSTYHNCETSSSVSVSRGVVDARVRGELWNGPWFALGATAGANLLERGDWMMGVYFGLHSRAFAGTR